MDLKTTRSSEIMAISHPISTSHKVDELFDTYLTKLIDAVYQAIIITSKFAGYIGILILSAFLIFIIPFLHFYLWRSNIKIKKKLEPIYNWINEAKPSELRYVHLEIERNNNLLRRVLSKNKILDKNILTMGVSNQANLIICKFFSLEETLKSAAYPSYDIPLKEDDIKELVSIFEGAPID